MTKYDKRDIFTHDDYLKTAATLKEEENKYICETAGFIPLEVKLKQFEQNGLVAQFQASDFTSTDYRNMYLNPDFDITPEDDIEDVFEKLNGLRAYQEEYKKTLAKSNGNNEPPTAAEAGTEEPKKEPEKAEN